MADDTGIRTFEMTVSIDGRLDVPFEDWPANVQDTILAALDRLSSRVELPLKLVHAEYKVDPDKQEDEPGRHYLHCIASEVVMADERTISPDRIVSADGPPTGKSKTLKRLLGRKGRLH